MKSSVTDQTPPRKRLTHPHLSTALILLFLIVVFILINVPGKVTPLFDEERPGHFYLSEFYLHGWPFDFLRRDAVSPFGGRTGSCWSLTQSVVSFQPIAMAADVLVALAFLTFAFLALQSTEGLRHRRFQFRIGTLILLISAIGYFLAGYRNTQSAVQRLEQRRVAAGDDGPYIEWQAGGPTWLRELVGDEILLPLDYPAGIHLYGDELDQASLLARDILYLHLENVSAEQVELLQHWPRLRVLDLSGATVLDGNRVPLASGDVTQDLEKEYSAATLELIKRLRPAQSIRAIDLSDTYLDDAGAAELAKLSQLTALRLYHTLITNEAIDDLGQLSNLQFLDLFDTNVTTAGALKLKQKLPRIKELYINRIENLAAE